MIKKKGGEKMVGSVIGVDFGNRIKKMRIEMKKTKRCIKEVFIEEYYSKEKDVVYWNWRFSGGEWNKQETPYKELPWIKVNLMET